MDSPTTREADRSTTRRKLLAAVILLGFVTLPVVLIERSNHPIDEAGDCLELFAVKEAQLELRREIRVDADPWNERFYARYETLNCRFYIWDLYIGQSQW